MTEVGEDGGREEGRKGGREEGRKGGREEGRLLNRHVAVSGVGSDRVLRSLKHADWGDWSAVWQQLPRGRTLIWLAFSGIETPCTAGKVMVHGE